MNILKSIPFCNSLERKFFFIMNIIVCGVFSQYWRKFTGQKMSSQCLSLFTLLIRCPPFFLFVELKKHILKQLLLYPFIIVKNMFANNCRSQIKIIHLIWWTVQNVKKIIIYLLFIIRCLMEIQHRDFHLLSAGQSTYDIVFHSYKKEGTCKTQLLYLSNEKPSYMGTSWGYLVKPFGPKPQSYELYESRLNAENKFYNLRTELELVGDMTFHQRGERWLAQML